jgi:tRNA(Ile)-lysidine synthase
MPLSLFARALGEDIVEEGLLSRQSKLVVAVSGGPDSMALLHALHELNEEGEFSLTLHVGHLNHQLRDGEAEEDAAFVHAAADHLGIPCSVVERDVAKIAAERGDSIEEVARNERYHTLERICPSFIASCGGRACGDWAGSRGAEPSGR